MRGILGLFRESPFGPLGNHRDTALRSGLLVADMIAAFLDGDGERLRAVADRIHELESQADEIANEIRGVMPSDVRLPVSRRDFLRLVSAQDDIADAAKKTAVHCLARQPEIPERVARDLRALAELAVDACREAETLLAGMDDLVVSTFGGPPAKEAFEGIRRTEEAAEKARDQADAALQGVFAEGDHLKAVDLILLMQLVECLADTAKAARHIAGRMRPILAN